MSAPAIGAVRSPARNLPGRALRVAHRVL